MIIVSAKHKIVGVPVRPDLMNIFPNANIVMFDGYSHLALDHTKDVTTLLRNFGMDVPAPVLTQYAFPHPPGKPPFLVQKKTVAMLTMSKRAYVLNGMGTGKTKAALWAFDYLKGNGMANKMLVVAPLSTLNFVWLREVFECVNHLSAVVLYGSRKRRQELLKEDHDIYIINHDGVGTIMQELSGRKDIDTILIDELAVFRKSTTDRSKHMRTLAQRMEWAWGMTGSPTPTEPTDVYGQARILTPDRVPKYFNRFRDDLMLKIGQFQYVPKKDAIDKAYRALQPSVRYTLDDVTELPEVIQRTIDIELGKRQKDVYNKMEDFSRTQVHNGEITAVNAGVLVNKLLQISTGYVYDSARNVVTLDNDDRLDRLVDDINSCGEKVLVFTPFVHSLNGIVARLKKAKIDVAQVSGETPQAQRSAIFNAFQNTNKYKAIAAHPMCMSHGLTLTKATLVIWFGPITSLETFDQANARIRRVGQTFKQLILMYAGTGVERKIYSMLRRRQAVQNHLLELFEGSSE